MTPAMSFINVCINYSDSVLGALMKQGHVKKCKMLSLNKLKHIQQCDMHPHPLPPGALFLKQQFSLSTASITTAAV